MGRITAGQFEQATWNVHDKAELRLGSDRQLKTAPRSIFGRAVRWLFGATKQDRADNKKIMGDLLANLQEKYGRDLGARAFLAAVPHARMRDDGVVEARVDKPLTARHVRLAERTAVSAKTEATKDAKKVMTQLGKEGGELKPDQLAKDFVSLARFSGTAKEAVIREGLWDAKDPKLVQAARYDSGRSKSEREQAHRALSQQSDVRWDNALKLLAASKQVRNPPPNHDLVGTAAQLVRQLGKDRGIPDHQVETLIRNVGTDSSREDVRQLSMALEDAAHQVQ